MQTFPVNAIIAPLLYFRLMPEDHNKVFTDAYTKLNAAQKKAVDTIDGPVMVIAGPGTGKTQILALRIANILLRTDTDPSSILALTFTESGVVSMRSRLVSLIGSAGYRVRIHTFHGFCNSIIRDHPDLFPRIIGSEPLIELDAIRIVKELIDGEELDLLRPSGRPYMYVRDILRALSEMKREYISTDALKTHINDARTRIESQPDYRHEKGAYKGNIKSEYVKELRMLDKAEECARIAVAYEQKLRAMRLYDFEDTIVEVINSLKENTELKLILQEEHQYLLADEHQDANGAQNELLELLSDFHENPNLFIVGDEKQAIYRFQGASLENFLFFKRKYPGAATVELIDNYRSSQGILDAAHELIAPTEGAHDIARPKLHAQKTTDEHPLVLLSAGDTDRELMEVGNRIRKHMESGDAAHEIAVLLRRNADISRVTAVCERLAIPYISYADDEVLSDPLIRSFIDLLRASATIGIDEYLYQALWAPFFALPPLDIYRLSTERRGGRAFMHATLRDKKELAKIDLEMPEKFLAFHALLEELSEEQHARRLPHFIEYATERSGFMEYILSRSDRYQTLERVRSLFEYIGTYSDAHPHATLADLLSVFDDMEEYGLSLAPVRFGAKDVIHVMTAHRAKGMEFDHVYIPFAHDERWGSSTGRTKLRLPIYGDNVRGTTEDDERRLFYVALTRARRSVTLTYAEHSPEGREQIPTRFSADIPDTLISKETAQSEELEFSLKKEKSLTGEIFSKEELKYIRERLATQGFSVSALNSYLESPWRYFFLNLLRIPKVQEPYLLFGTAIDGALKWFATERSEGRDPTKDKLIDRFVYLFTRMSLSDTDFQSYKKKGVEALTGYYKEYAKKDETNTKSAVSISVAFKTCIKEMPEITLRGELDKVEFLNEHDVRVVDYKTGKPKSRNDIEGKTKSSNGNYKRQLVFYKLLIDRDTSRNWNMKEGVLDFVEPDQKGRYKREVFEITDTDLQELQTEIRRSLKEIYDLSFVTEKCDPSVWSKEGCRLVERIQNGKSV